MVSADLDDGLKSPGISLEGLLLQMLGHRRKVELGMGHMLFGEVHSMWVAQDGVGVKVIYGQY